MAERMVMSNPTWEGKLSFGGEIGQTDRGQREVSRLGNF